MATTKQELGEWFDEGVRKGATHMIIVCDTFNYEDYPVFVKPGENAQQTMKRINGKNLQVVMEVYALHFDKAVQLAEHRAMHLDDAAAPKSKDSWDLLQEEP